MAHLLDFTTGQAAFTRRQDSEPAWHQLGGETPQDASLEVWAKNARLNFHYAKAPVQFHGRQEDGLLFPTQIVHDRQVVYRTDSGSALSVVGKDYKLVQPIEILDFFRDLIKDHGFVMETAGALKGGSRVWALASTGESAMIKGIDRVNQYLLLTTAVDGKTATHAQFTSVRVVCNNTLTAAMAGSESQVRVHHGQTFRSGEVKRRLGLAPELWNQFKVDAERLAETHLMPKVAESIITDLFQPEGWNRDQDGMHPTVVEVFNLYRGAGRGAAMTSAANTAWGLVNAVTEYVDYRGRGNADQRLNRMWFGTGRVKKEAVWQKALTLAA